MTVKITVNSDRTMTFDGGRNGGTVGENNAVRLCFDVPAQFSGFDRQLIINTDAGSFVKSFGESFDIPLDFTVGEEMKIQLKLTDIISNIVWKSKAYTLRLNTALDSSGKNIYTELAEGKRREVAEALSGNANASAADYLGMTWDELMNAVGSADFLSADDRERIEVYNMLIRKLYAFYEPYSNIITIDPIFPPGGEIIPGDELDKT